MSNVMHHVSRFTDFDIQLFKEGNHYRLYEKLGSHLMNIDGVNGTYFAVWAPNAESVSVFGSFNGWDQYSHRLRMREDGSGIWEGFIPGVGNGTLYKYHIISKYNNYQVDKGDPFAFYWQVPPETASIVWDTFYWWNDWDWMSNRHGTNSFNAPYSIYEIHIGSWRRVQHENNRSLTYRELADQLAGHLQYMGFTHVEFMPVMEHPFFGSWGYQITGYFAPSSRYGTPQDFMYLIERLHQNGIGVILDWVPSHFPDDIHGLVFFDGTHLYEHPDPRRGFHPHWNSYIFNYGRNEVRSFLISNAIFWLDRYHVDGLRVDAVASMLYLDYGRREGEWLPNEYGGKENIDAINFLRKFNEVVYGTFPDVQTIAEESTAWPMVTRPTYDGGLGFGMKWNMGWMHDTLHYFSVDPLFRKHIHNMLSYSLWYAFSENFILPLSHDEVVYGKKSLLSKMHGDNWQKFASLRLLYGYMYTHPGKKLLFMGSEIGQWREWVHDDSLEWYLLQYDTHRGVQQWVKDLNHFYKWEPAVHQLDFNSKGFEWIDYSDWQQSVIAFIRKGFSTDTLILVVCNFTPIPRYNYKVGVPRGGYWKEVLNSDSVYYGGSGHGNLGGVNSVNEPSHGREHSLYLTLPPLSVIILRNE
ncbi:MAG: 1,4-alpha-glucan branching protein GlgB [Nitrospirae bacterium]|nr:MAG: 1,4-alpha-glucan branching protein GlgB [Nitrospirota bacterium]